MPRIDPEQLLKCLSVLLSPNGGIKSVEEVIRLVTLMLRFSKKLVSKCIYINILKCTETEILGSFMTAGGWAMTLTWLNEGIVAKNWPLVEEILKLLFLCPVDVERLKSNTFPRKVKALSKDASHPGVQFLATCLVERWLKVVKGEVVPPLVASEVPVCPIKFEQVCETEKTIEETLQGLECAVDNLSNELKVLSDTDIQNSIKSEIICSENGEIDSKSDINCSNSIGVDEQDSSVPHEVSNSSSSHKVSDKDKKKSDRKSSDRKKSSHSDKSHDEKSDKKSERRNSSSSSSRSSSHSSHKSRDHSKKDHDKKDRDSSKKDSNRDKSRDKDRSKDKSSDKHKDKDRHKSSESKSKEKSSSSSNSKSDKSSSGKLQTVSISDLGKIPKKKSTSDESGDVKKNKHSISIEVRKPTDSMRPRTVKTFHSKFRSHGLEEEVKPPPPRGQVKKPSATTLPTIPTPIPKRTSPMRSLDAPPEKKPKISEIVEKPGSIKLIPPKPKPVFLQESVMFIDALTASATNKKEPKKKKRKLSISKDTSHEASPPTSPSTPTTPKVEQASPTADLPKSAPFRFYQDTLDSEDNKEVKEEIKEEVVDPDVHMEESDKDPSDSITMKSPLMSPPRRPKETIDSSELDQIDIVMEMKPETEGGLKSILTISKSKGAKKSLRWRDTNLEDIQYFELDENERVNVTRTFLDMKQMERVNEREAFQKARNLINDDLMGEQTTWRALIPIEAPEVEYGKKSREKDVQLAREKTVFQCMYLNKGLIPDSASEPDNETHQVTDPVIIPLEDISGGTDNVEDLSDRPWPEPKSYGPPVVTQGISGPPNMYNPMPPFGPGFPNPAMPGPVFAPGPGVMPGDWTMNNPNMMMPNGMTGPPEMFMGPGGGPMFMGPGTGPMGGEFPMMDNMNGPMFPQGFPGPMGPNMVPNGPMMNRPIGPNGPNGPPFGGFPGNRGNSNRGGSNNSRGGGGGPWRGKGSWNGPPRGGNNSTRGNSKRCIHFQKKGYCRQENNCHFAHY